MARLAVHICGLPPREDGQWYRLGYLSHKCGRCPFVADYVRVQPGKRAEYRCTKCKEEIRIPFDAWRTADG